MSNENYSPIQVQQALMTAYGMVPFPTPEDFEALRNGRGEMPKFSREQWHEALVADKAKQLLMSTGEGGRLFAEVAPVAKAEKVFRSIIAGIETEASSGRAVLILHSRIDPNAQNEDKRNGYEKIRTEFLNDPHGRLLARQAKDLIGHNVIVFAEMQPMQGRTGQNVRVLKGIKALGKASDADIHALRTGQQAAAA